MAFLDMFDKLDDIIYKPVEAVTDWVKEPLKKWEHKREMESERNSAEVEAYAARQAVKLAVDQRKWNVEIDELIADNQARHNEQMVEALKHYQLELSNATKEIVESLGLMSIELRRQANSLLEEKTLEYKKIQDDAKRQSMAEIKEAKEMFFEDDPETYKIMVNTIMAERKAMVDVAQRFMLELSEDFKRLNSNTDALLKMGMNNVNKYLEPMANQLSTTANIEYNRLEIKDDIIDI